MECRIKKLSIYMMIIGLFAIPLLSNAQDADTAPADSIQEIPGQIRTDKILKNYSVTLHAGFTGAFTDIRSKDFPFTVKDRSDIQWAVGASATRMFGGVFGLQADYTFGKLQGAARTVNSKGAGSQIRNNWVLLGFDREIFFNTYIHQGSLNMYVNISNMFVGTNRYIRAKMEGRSLDERKFSLYGKVGIGFISFNSTIKDFKTGKPLGIKHIYNKNDPQYNPNFKYRRGYTNRTTEFVVPLSLGVKYKINRNFDIGLEGQYTLVLSDKLDALAEVEGATMANIGGRFDKWAQINAGITYKFGSKQTQKEHLEWVNSLESYMDLTDAKLADMYVVKDADNDGVIDELDWEPDTEEGAFVDTHGRTLDSDGDGIPDHLDPEPFSTPYYPIDSNGMNIRPDRITPESIRELIRKEVTNQLSGWFMKIVFFDLDKSNIRPSEVPELYQVATYMLKYPEAKMNIKGYTDVRASEKYNMGLSERRSDSVVDYLNKTYGIDKSRFIESHYGESNNLFKNATKEQQHQLNRRVEITVAE